MAKYLSNIDLNKNQLQNPVIHSLGTAPATPVEGQIYFDSTAGDKHIYLYNGTAWVQLSEGTHTTDYVSNVSLSGTDLTFTGVGNAFNGTVDLSSLDEIVNDSTITIDAGTYLSTGGSFTLNQASNATITIDHDDTSRSDTTSTDAPSYGGTFEAVTSVATNTTGHVTGINVSTVTLPTSDNTTYDLTGAVSNVTDFAISLSGSDASLDKVFLKASDYITLTDGGSNDVIIAHSDTTRSDTTSTDAPAFGGTFTAVKSVTTNATGHVTSIDVSTVTIPASDNTDTTYQLSVGAGATDTAVVTLDASSGTDTTLTVGVQDQALTISETTGVNGTITLGLNSEIEKSISFTEDISIQGELSMGSTIDMSNNLIQNVTDPSNPQDAATKAYVDAATVGGLVYQGGYDANLNSPDLTTSPNSIKKGWTYTVTADGTFFGEQLRVGDVLIAEVDDPSALADWTTVQNNVDLASLTQVGIGNVNAGTGISVSYASGTATITNTQTNSNNTFADTITDTDNVEHGLGTQDVIVQLYDVTTGETVYADVDRTGANDVYITFASTPTNSIRVLVQKIG